MIPVCFVANYHLTPVFIAIAGHLRARGVAVRWITVNHKLRADILDAGWEAVDILALDFRERVAPAGLPAVPPLKYHDLIAADRALSLTPMEGLAFLQAAAPRIQAFLREHGIGFVFGEPTWAHERLTAHICRLSSMAQYLSPHTIRLPAGRWGFFAGDDQAQLVSPGGDGPAAVPAPIKVEAPAYLAMNDARLRKAASPLARLDKLRRFITRENIAPEDPTHIHSRLDTWKVRATSEIQRELYRFVQRRPFDAALQQQPFLLYCLHKQPESSIDVLGRYYEDQQALIRAIHRTLPPGWLLLVKEHTNAIGDRSLRFFKRLQRLPGLVVVDEKCNSHTLIDHAQAIVSVSGTVAYEAALKNKPALTFAPMFFNAFPTCRRIGIDDLRQCDDIRTLFPQPDAQRQQEASRMILEHSFEGKYTDARSDPSVLDPDNISKLAHGFMTLQTP